MRDADYDDAPASPADALQVALDRRDNGGPGAQHDGRTDAEPHHGGSARR